MGENKKTHSVPIIGANLFAVPPRFKNQGFCMISAGVFRWIKEKKKVFLPKEKYLDFFSHLTGFYLVRIRIARYPSLVTGASGSGYPGCAGSPGYSWIHSYFSTVPGSHQPRLAEQLSNSTLSNHCIYSMNFLYSIPFLRLCKEIKKNLLTGYFQ